MDVIETLIAEYTAWCSAQGLPQLSADELIFEDITEQQRKYLTQFIERWDNAA